jgi:ParB family chromosome partitioning protein
MKGVRRAPACRVELARLAHNPFNPREALTAVEEVADSLRVRGQVQPLTVVHREVFLRAHPGQEDQLGSADYVVIDGNRRLAAAALAGLTELRVDVNDTLADTAADILESALVANIHRMDVPPLDQAKAIEELVRAHGSQSAVARRLGKTPAWVSQRLALLQLTPELQSLVQAGRLNVEAARRIGRLPVSDQGPAAEKALHADAPKPRRVREGPKQTADRATVNAVHVAAPGQYGSSSGAHATQGLAAGGITPAKAADLLAATFTRQDLLVVVSRLLAILHGPLGADGTS